MASVAGELTDRIRTVEHGVCLRVTSRQGQLGQELVKAEPEGVGTGTTVGCRPDRGQETGGGVERITRRSTPRVGGRRRPWRCWFRQTKPVSAGRGLGIRHRHRVRAGREAHNADAGEAASAASRRSWTPVSTRTQSIRSRSLDVGPGDRDAEHLRSASPRERARQDTRSGGCGLAMTSGRMPVAPRPGRANRSWGDSPDPVELVSGRHWSPRPTGAPPGSRMPLRPDPPYRPAVRSLEDRDHGRGGSRDRVEACSAERATATPAPPDGENRRPGRESARDLGGTRHGTIDHVESWRPAGRRIADESRPPRVCGRHCWSA